MNSTRQGAPPDDDGEDKPRVTPRIAAEAAAWVARLHGPSRSREMELKCLEWQGRSKAHRHAFERCTEVWMEVPNAARAGGFTAARSPLPSEDDDIRKPRRRGLFVVAGVGVAVVLTGLAMYSWPDSDDYRTAIGEAQTVGMRWKRRWPTCRRSRVGWSCARTCPAR